MKDELFAKTFHDFCNKHDIKLKSMKWGIISGLDIVCCFNKVLDDSEFIIHARNFGLPDGMVRLTIRLKEYEVDGYYSVCLVKGMALVYTNSDSMEILYDILNMYTYGSMPLL